MPTVETTSPIEVEVNVTTESPTLNLQIDGYLRSELYVVDIVYRRGSSQFVWRWEFSATATEIAYAAAHGKYVIGRRIDRSGGNVPVYSECVFDGIGDDDPVTVSFKEIGTSGITTFTATGDSNIASMTLVPFSGGGSEEIERFNFVATYNAQTEAYTITSFSAFADIWEAYSNGKTVEVRLDAGGEEVHVTTSLWFWDFSGSTPTKVDIVFSYNELGYIQLQYYGGSWRMEFKDTWDPSAIQAPPSPTSGQYLTYNGTTWVASNLPSFQTQAITDTGGYFTTDTVEGALQEIGASKLDKAQGVANAGKYLVVGNDGTVTPDSMSSQQIQTAVDDWLDDHAASIDGLSFAAKNALMNLLSHVAYTDANGQQYYDALYGALFNGVELASISAVYTQGGTVYTHDSLNSLKADLVVTATFSDSTTATVAANDYTLSGTLTAGTSTVTVTYGGETTTFSVTVTAGVPSTYTVWDYIESNASSGSAYAVPYAGQIRLKQYDNLNAVSCEFAWMNKNTFTSGGCIFGRRTASGSASSFAFYNGNNLLGYHLHGNDSDPKPSAVMNTVHIVKYTNTSASPSSLQVDDSTPVSVVWVNNNTINADPCILTNPYDNSANFNLTYLTDVGYIKVFDSDGNLISHYIPALRTADNVIGMYDIIDQTFYTASTASYATIGNSNQKYKVGNWS